MASLYPGSIDTSTELPSPTGSNTLNSPDHAALHSNENAAVVALETKLGTGSSTASAGRLLRGTGSGATAYGQLVMSTDVAAFTSADLRGVVSDETGSGVLVFGTSPTLGTPTLTNPTISGSVTGSGVISQSNVAAGFAVQVVGTTFAAVATGTTTVPVDDTIPQITEGIEFMTQAITPKAATNLLVIEAVLVLAHSVASQTLVAALFQDATANALAATFGTTVAFTNSPFILTFGHVMTAGTTSSITFRVRAGSGGAGTTTFNGAGAARFFGAISKSYIKITEVKV